MVLIDWLRGRRVNTGIATIGGLQPRTRNGGDKLIIPISDCFCKRYRRRAASVLRIVEGYRYARMQRRAFKRWRRLALP
jgi:hypothetical protein